MLQKTFKSGIFITGVRKCGTTTLFDTLTQHSKIQEGRLKEPQFFCLLQETIQANETWYAQLFADHEAYLLDGSTYYYQLPESYDRINTYFEKPFYLLCLRDPAKRFYSAYWHMRGKPNQVETRSLKEIIQGIKGENAASILENERAFIQLSAKAGKIDLQYLDASYHARAMGAPFSSEGLRPASAFEYYAESMYSQNYESFRAQAQSHVIIFEQLLQDTERTLQELYQFLDLLPESAALLLPDNRNLGKDASGSKALQGGIGKQFYAYAKAYFGKELKGWLLKNFSSFFYSPIPKLSRENYLQLRELLKEEYDFWFNEFPELEKYWQ